MGKMFLKNKEECDTQQKKKECENIHKKSIMVETWITRPAGLQHA
jgi:hypothetical protein